MKNINSIFLIIFTLFGCEEVIDWPVASDEIRLVVEGRITNELKTHQIKLTETADYFNPAAPTPVEGATVIVFDGDNNIPFVESSPGVYQSSPFAGEVGRTYDLSIRLASPLAKETDFTASSTMLLPASLDSMSAVNDIYNEDDPEEIPVVFTRLAFWGVGNLDQENSYMAEVYVNDQLETDTINNVIVFGDDFIGEEFTDFAFYDIDEPSATGGDSITLVMHVVENEFVDFYDQLLTESELRDPFGLSSPPANVSTNISGSALGYFYVSSVDTVHAFVQDDLQ
ncbi:MAG: DUF4249 family protein [Bacteroidota bacterium]